MSEAPQTPPPGKAAGPRSGRGIRIALAVSLALNVLILGLVGGAVLNRPDPGDAPALRVLGLGPFALVLPREARDDIRHRIERDLEEVRRERAQIGLSLMALRRALLADPFDREAASRALGQSRDAAAALQARGHGALLDTLEGMSLEERAAIADRLGRTLRRLSGRERDDVRGD